MIGAHDGIYRYVSMWRVPLYLDQGWRIVWVEREYAAIMRAPL